MLVDSKSKGFAHLQPAYQSIVAEITPCGAAMNRVAGSPVSSTKRRGTTWLRVREAIRCNLAAFYPDMLTWTGVSPVFANLRITNRCPAKCQSCQHWMESSDFELTTEEWKTILHSLRNARFLGVSLTGGDIFMRSDSLELLHFATGIGLGVHVTLNGFTLTETLAKELMKAEPSTVFLSLDDLTDNLDQIRGMENASQRVIDSIRLLRKFDNGKTRLGLAQTIMKSTLRAVKGVTKYAIQNGLHLHFNLIHFTHYFFATSFSREQYELDQPEQRKLFDTVAWLAKQHRKYPDRMPKLTHLRWTLKYFNDYHQKKSPCYKPLLKICVDPNGDVRPCCSMDPVGNLVKQGLREVLGAPQFLAVVKRGLAKDCPGCSCHYTMSLDYNLLSRIREGLLHFGFARLK